jgi:trehalose-6-phosphate synthase
VAILSLFTSCCRVLNGALVVNPWIINSVVAAMTHAVNMPHEERTKVNGGERVWW